MKRHSFEDLASIAGLIGVTGGCLVLAGWTFGIEILTRVAPGLRAMNPATAAGLSLAGLSLYLATRPRRAGGYARLALAALVVAAGTARLSDDAFGTRAGIDQWLFYGELQGKRMAPNTAAELLLLGLALLLIDARARRGVRPAEFLALAACMGAMLPLLGYAYDEAGASTYAPMAVHTAGLFAVLSFGVLCARPGCGLAAVFTSPYSGGTVARRLLPVAITAPVLLGWLLLIGQEAGLYDPQDRLVLTVISIMAAFLLVLAWTAASLNRADYERDRAYAALQNVNEELEQRVEQRTSELARANRALLAEVEQHRRSQDTLRRMELEVRQTQKLDAIGRLAGGVAHDFNNLLTLIIGYTELVQDETPQDDPRRPLLNEILDAGRRSSALARQLLVFSRRQVVESQSVDLNAIVSNLGRMLRRLIGEHIELLFNLSADLARVEADPSQLEQVLMNLAINSRDSMPEGGTLVIETANVELDAAHAEQHLDVTPGRYVLLAVSDTGCGMDAETRSHIFEPFFTTKGPGKGTGLGLATVYGIVKQSRGHVWVYSEPGQGTTFKIFLPALADTVDAADDSAGPAPRSGRAETILVVEDQESIRILVRRILHQNGYVVLVADSGRAALELVDERPSPIDLLLTDVVMPRMSGKQLAEELLQRQPGLKVLYMSGYTDGVVLPETVQGGRAPLLQKPFSSAGLLKAVRAVLDQKPAGMAAEPKPAVPAVPGP